MTTSANFDELYQAHYARVFGLCRRLLNSVPLAEEATQEAFMRAYQQFSHYDTQQPFWPWIASITNNYCIDLLRKNSRSPDMFEIDAIEHELTESSNSHTLNSLIADESNQGLAIAIAGLSDKYRIPLVLAYFNGDSYDEIATNLAITRNHVGILLLRAKQQLREQMSNSTQEIKNAPCN